MLCQAGAFDITRDHSLDAKTLRYTGNQLGEKTLRYIETVYKRTISAYEEVERRTAREKEMALRKPPRRMLISIVKRRQADIATDINESISAYGALLKESMRAQASPFRSACFS